MKTALRLLLIIIFVGTVILVSDILSRDMEIVRIGTYESGVFDESAAEICAFDPQSKQLYVVNADNGVLDIISIYDPTTPKLMKSIKLSEYGAEINSVAIHKDIIAVAVEADTTQNPGGFHDVKIRGRNDFAVQNHGAIVFLNSKGDVLGHADTGAQPDMITFSPNGKYVLTANEGEPGEHMDPEGSITIIDVSGGVKNPVARTASFTKYIGKEDELRKMGIRIYNPGSNAAQDIEPEYIAVTKDSKTAFATLQENNAVAVIDIEKAEVIKLLPLGYKDHSKEGNELDASNKDEAINIRNWPVFGMYQPDAIETFEYKGKNYFLTANEGDAREWEETRIGKLELDEEAFPNYEELQEKKNLGRLKTTIAMGDENGDGKYEKLYSYGARSFSIWDEDGKQIYDSGSDIERFLAENYKDNFNSTNDENDSFDSRSDDKGPEPEGLELAEINGTLYALVGLERMGGIMIYEISNPKKPKFVTYVNDRDYNVKFNPDNVTKDDLSKVGSLGPEGILYISKKDSPTEKPLIITANEVSGSVSIFEIK